MEQDFFFLAKKMAAISQNCSRVSQGISKICALICQDIKVCSQNTAINISFLKEVSHSDQGSNYINK